MIEKLFPLIVLAAIVVAAGLLLAWRSASRYRRELGLRQTGQEKTPDVSFVISAFQDVTRQLKEKERELERLRALAESRAEDILQCVSNGVIAFDGDGKVSTVNRAAEELLGLSREEMLGRTCAELFSSAELCRFISGALQDRVTSQRMETAVTLKQNRLWLGFNTALLTDRQGGSGGVILSFSDLTEVKRLQEQVELKERLTALGEMSAGIAHELRNPMAVIAGYVKLLAKREDEAGQQVLRDITAEIDGMNRIIGDLLTFARPTALNRVPVDLRELATTCVEHALPLRRGSGAITSDLRLAPLSLSLDEGLMRQALGNIVQNALDAMPEGGALTVGSAAAGGEAVLRISDTGHGIAPENVRKVFLPFFTTREQGVGMGLALAHKIVTAHGGRIDVESGQGKGTTFTISLPLP
jgi:PAS domain S-box-containing protein